MDGRDIAAMLELGASAAQLGTAFLTTAESGAHSAHKQALLQHDSATGVTQCFTGKPARGLLNAWAREMADVEGRLPNCFNCLPCGRAASAAAVKAEQFDN